MDKYKNLTACCDGDMTLDKLERFVLAMDEFHEFMEKTRRLLAPACPQETEQHTIEDTSSKAPQA